MTLGVYNKKLKYFAYDTKACGGPNGIHDTEKTAVLVEDGIRKFLSFHAGILVHPGKVLSLMKEHLKGDDISTELYEYRDAMFPLVGDNAEIFVYDFKHGYGYLLQEKSISIITKETVTMGSGSYYAEGMFLLDPETDIQQAFEMVSKYDAHTGEDYHVIRL